MTDTFETWYKNLRLQLQKNNARTLVVLKGDIDWCIGCLCKFSVVEINSNNVAETFLPSVVIYTNNRKIKSNLGKNSLKRVLGTENDTVVFLDHDFDADAFAAISGTIVGGGVMFLCLDSNSTAKSLFIERLSERVVARISQFQDIYHLQQNDSDLPVIKQSGQLDVVIDSETPILGHCKNREQYDAVEAVHKVFSGHRDRPLVLTADRGRGKSCAMAIACAHIIEQATIPLTIGICAPNIANVDIFFAQLNRCLPAGHLNKGSFSFNTDSKLECNVSFYAIDQLLTESPKLSLLLFDEAAGFPVSLLERCARDFHRVVYSSTIHGYEGAGRGFSIKFLKTLGSLRPEFRHLHLTKPIRWAADDPLEGFINDALLLDAPLPIICNDANDAIAEFCIERDIAFKVIAAKELCSDELLLKQVFSLLVTAHYQTSPADLKQLLENPNIKVAVLEVRNNNIGIALLMSEGGESVELIEDVRNNKRRLRDQFLPQSLLTHCGKKNAFAYRYLRIMRIAIHPDVQSKGFGGLFLELIEKHASEEGFDFTGSSFGCNYDLLKFWFTSHYRMARLGFSKDKASGEYSALVLKATLCNREKSNNKQFLEELSQNFYGVFNELLADEFSELDAKLLWLILNKQLLTQLPDLNEQQVSDVEDFSLGFRQYSACVYGLKPWLLRQSVKDYSDDFPIISAKVLQKRTIKTICELHGLTGKKAFNDALVRFVKTHYQIS